MNQICMISGMPHSATRLVYDLLSRSGKYLQPDNTYLNAVRELPVFHASLSHALMSTKVNEALRIGEKDIAFILQSLFELIPEENREEKRAYLVKMPYYPVVFHEVFQEAAKSMGMSLSMVIVERDKDHIFRSYLNRNEDIKYSVPELLFYQVNKLPLSYKKKAVTCSRFSQVFDLQYQAFEEKLTSVSENMDVTRFDTQNSFEADLASFLGKEALDASIINRSRLDRGKSNWIKKSQRKLERVYLQYKHKHY